MHWLRRHPGAGRPPHPDVLTPAEWRVLEHLREGMPNAEIAIRLGVSVNTVRTHVSSMLAKLELSDRQALAAWDGTPAEVSRRQLERTRFALPLADWQAALRLASVGGLAVAGAFVLWFAIGAASDGGPTESGSAPPAATTEPTAIPEPTPAPEVTPEATPEAEDSPSEPPYHAVFQAGEVIDVFPAVLFIDPGTGETEAWVFPAHTWGGEFGVSPEGSYIIWRDAEGLRLFRTDDQSDREISADSLPIEYGPGDSGFIATTQEQFVVSRFDGTGDHQADLWRGGVSAQTDAAWSPDGSAVAYAIYPGSGSTLQLSIRPTGNEGRAHQIEVGPGQGNVSVRWSRNSERVAVVTADRVRVLTRGGDPLWEFEGDFYGNPRWSPDDRHLYVNAMPGNAADVAYLFTADGEPLFRFITSNAGGCGGEVWLDDDRFAFGEHEIRADGSVAEAPRHHDLFPDLSAFGLVVETGIHFVHYEDESRWALDDGRLLVTTPAVGHGGCATGLAGTNVPDRLERPPFE